MPNGTRPHHQTEPPPVISKKELETVIEQGDAITLNEITKKLGRYYAQGGDRDKLSSSQIRNILDKLQQMRSFDLTTLQLLRPLLAYAAGRHGGKVKHLQQISDDAIQMVGNDKQFNNFKNFFEAIVAYHRYHGGK